MRKLAIILLTLTDGRIVFQRRGKDAPLAPGKLGFFGGHVDEGESYDEAIDRELAEETSLDPKKLSIGFVDDYVLHFKSHNEDRHFHLFWAELPNADFEVDKSESQGVEVYSRAEALKRDDLTVSTRHVLENILKEKS